MTGFPSGLAQHVVDAIIGDQKSPRPGMQPMPMFTTALVEEALEAALDFRDASGERVMVLVNELEQVGWHWTNGRSGYSFIPMGRASLVVDETPVYVLPSGVQQGTSPKMALNPEPLSVKPIPTCRKCGMRAPWCKCLDGSDYTPDGTSPEENAT